MKHLQQPDLSALSIRTGEQRIGEVCHVWEPSISIADHPGQFALLGIPEDIGPRANQGKGGADGAWAAMLGKLINMQHHLHNTGDELLILGTVQCDDLMQASMTANITEQRALVTELDARVESIVSEVSRSGKTLLVVGGGHNNCYPIISGMANGLFEAGLTATRTVNAVNLDPHADLRSIEGRHSGNGFSYALRDGVLARYAAIGLHLAYNNQHIWQQFTENESLFCNTFEDYIAGKKTFAALVWEGLAFVGQSFFGAELDIDSIANIPASAQTPSGISLEQARYFAMQAGGHLNCKWFHLPEAAPLPHNTDQTGKLLAYLITDFIRARLDVINHMAH
jgi:formiminoglutamase